MNSYLREATYYTKSVGVAILASCAAYIINWVSRKAMGRVANSLFSPVIEELLKTLLAQLFVVSTLLVHTTFGIVEAITDARHSERPNTAVALAIITHSIFGVVTVLGWRYFSIYAGISASLLLHMLWNSFVHDLVNLQRKD